MDKGWTGVGQSLDRFVKKCENGSKYKVFQDSVKENWKKRVGQVGFFNKNWNLNSSG